MGFAGRKVCCWYPANFVVFITVRRACARNGVHYVDLTGETVWIREIIEKCVGQPESMLLLTILRSCVRYHYVATKTGAIIVPSCGLDSIPADLSAFLGNKTLKSHGVYPQHHVLLDYPKYGLYHRPIWRWVVDYCVQIVGQYFRRDIEYHDYRAGGCTEREAAREQSWLSIESWYLHCLLFLPTNVRTYCSSCIGQLLGERVPSSDYSMIFTFLESARR